MPKSPNVWVRLRLEKNPYTNGTLTYDFTFEGNPISHTAGWKEDRLISISRIERALSTPDGSIEIARVQIVVNDTDGILRALLDDEETEYWDGQECDICVSSDELFVTSPETPWYLMKGRIEGFPTILSDRQIGISVVDVIGSEFSAFNLEKNLAIPIGDEHDDLPEGLEANYNQVVGEHNDEGALATDGTLVDKGLIPGVYVGMYDISGGADPPPASTAPVIPPPTNLHHTVTGGSGKKRYYAASVITPYGESNISDVMRVDDAPEDSEMETDGLNHHVKMRCDFNAGAGHQNKVRWWGRYANPPAGYLDEGFYDYGAGDDQPDRSYYNDGAHPAPNPTRIDFDHVKKMKLPSNPSGAISPDVDTIWGMVIVGIGEIEVHGAPYASNLAEEDTPSRVQMGAALEGVEYITPNSPQWPHPNPWLEKANSAGQTIRFTCVYMRGARLQAHIDGSVTIAFNCCGYKGTNGLMVSQAFYQLQMYLNEFVLKNFGQGYRYGDMHVLETFMDGKPILWTRKFRVAQEASMRLTSDAVGFEGAWCINSEITLREFLRRFCVTFGSLFGINHFGQPFPVLPTTDIPLTQGRLYRWPYDLERVPVSQPQAQYRVNRVPFEFDYDTDLGQFRFTDYEAVHEASQTAHGRQGVKRIFETETKQLYCTRSLTTATAAMGNFVTMYQKTPVHLTIEPLDLTGLHDELGDRVRVAHWNTVRPDEITQILVLRHGVDPMPGQESVTLVGMDMNRVS